jgi:hypothetical protein
MQDGFSIISPAGYFMNVGVVSPLNGPGTYGGVVVAQILPGGSVQARGVGEHILSPLGYQLSGRQGTMLINCTTGTAGSAQGIAFIAVSPTIMLGVALDTDNRPYGVILDILGNQAGKSGVFGPPILEGTPLTIQFAWDINNIVYADDRAGFQFNNQVEVWYPDVVTWTPFVPTSLYVGTSFGGLSLADFAGTVGMVQVSNEVTFDVLPGAIIEEEEYFNANATMPGESTASAVPFLVLGGDATLDGDSSQTADADMALAGASTMDGDSSVTALGGLFDQETLTLNGDSSQTAGATVALVGASTMAGDSSQTVGGTVALAGAAAPAGDSSQTAGVTVAYAGGSTMDGDSGFTATATVTPP